MSLSPGTRLGPYEILAAIGEGGMGEVYRATDSNLKRSVAIKVLPASMAGDADRLARFQREAEVLAALNHPNIAAIYGLEKTANLTALVMELVEGEDLSSLVYGAPGLQPWGTSPRPKGPGLQLTDALPIARQIADALEAAHEQGIIHRDLKPQNIKVRADGTVKVLDFGLAKALDPPSPEATGGKPDSAMNSPTMTARMPFDYGSGHSEHGRGVTHMGMILGTAAYMAPEQAKGKSVDKRADIWAFGVVLYEMVTGRRLFDAEDISETLAAVLTRDVSLPAMPADIPPRLRALLSDCLIRDPKQRLRDIGEARRVLDRIRAGAPDDGVAPGAAAAATPVVPAWRRALPWAVAGMLAVALVFALVVWAPWRSTPAPTPRKLLAAIGANAELPSGFGASAILSPDGTTLAFVGQEGNQPRLFIRKLDQLQAAPLAGTEGAANPFFSPNGQWLAFFAAGKLKKVSVTGGAAVNLCDVESGRGGTWLDDDTIIFSPTGGPNSRLSRVPAAGGTPATFGTLSQGATTQRWPDALPGGNAVLYTEHSTLTGYEAANLVVVSVTALSADLSAEALAKADAWAKGGAPKVIVRGGYYGRYVPSGLASPKRSEREGGHLIYLQQGTLFAAPFDPVRLEVVGPAVPAIEGLVSNPASGGAQVALSSEGTLAYVPGANASAANPIDWMTRDGTTSVLRATKADWTNPRFSPDGRKLALAIFDGTQRDIWVYEWARDTLTQLTFDGGEDTTPVWTPDSKRIAFASDRAKPGTSNLYWVNGDGSGEVTRLTDSPDDQRAASWHPSGTYLGYGAFRPGTGWDLMMLPMDGDTARGLTPGKPTLFLGTPALEAYPMFSPDGRFVAYFSTEAGGTAWDVYVRPFPGPGGKWRVSTDFGIFPRWSATAHELLFVSPGQEKVMFAPYAIAGDSFRADKPQIWSPTRIRGLGTVSPYDVHPDGKRFVGIAVQDQSVVQDKVVFVFNFFDYLRKIAPAKK